MPSAMREARTPAAAAARGMEGVRDGATGGMSDFVDERR
jgi:hypothetical protein